MGERKHKVESGENKDKVNAASKKNPQPSGDRRMGKGTYKRHRAKPEQTTQRLALKPLKIASRHQAAVQRIAIGALRPDDLLALQKTLGNKAVAGLLAQAGHGPGLESTPAPAVQRQDSMDEEEHITAVDAPNKKDEDGGIWGHMKEAWAKIQSEQKTTPESGSEPAYSPQEGTEDPVDSGEWTEELQY
jgi:hypothetical protein